MESRKRISLLLSIILVSSMLVVIGDKFTFTIPEKLRTGLRAQHEDTPELMKKLELHISVVSFGDGTGIVAERLHERKRSHSDMKKNHHSGRPGKSASVEPPTRRMRIMLALRNGGSTHCNLLLRERRRVSQQPRHHLA
jgi:hypothetical protein